MKTLFLLSICVLVSGCLSAPPIITVGAEVTKVVACENVTLKFNNRTEEVRFRGIDTPEVNAC